MKPYVWAILFVLALLFTFLPGRRGVQQVPVNESFLVESSSPPTRALVYQKPVGPPQVVQGPAADLTPETATSMVARQVIDAAYAFYPNTHELGLLVEAAGEIQAACRLPRAEFLIRHKEIFGGLIRELGNERGEDLINALEPGCSTIARYAEAYNLDVQKILIEYRAVLNTFRVRREMAIRHEDPKYIQQVEEDYLSELNRILGPEIMERIGPEVNGWLGAEGPKAMGYFTGASQ